jgi:peptidoglycan/LPS O-acetylase OafA/YrhL
MPAANPTPHVRSLDALRGILSLTVVVAHALQIFSYPQTGLYMGFPARAAVLFFFCLSGFVIAMSIHANIRRNGGFDAREYAMSRFTRIAPPFLAVVLLTWAFASILAGLDATRVDLESAARNHFFAVPLEQMLALFSLTVFGDLTGGLVNGPVWSLVFEVQLYVIAGLLVLAWSRKGPVAWFVLALVTAYVCVFGIVGLKLRTLCYLAFGFGAAAYALRNVRARTLLVGLLLAVPIATLFGIRASSIPMLHMDGAWTWISFQVALSAVFALLVIAAARVPIAFHLRDFSYTLYILHFPLFLFVYFLMYRYWPDSLARWANPLAVIAVPTAVLLSALVGRVEGLRLRRRDAARSASAQPTAVSAGPASAHAGTGQRDLP